MVVERSPTKPLKVALILLCLGPVLGSCSSFSGYVADHWPRWAGGLPDDVPPRPGAPGYDEFIAHKQQEADAAKAAGGPAGTAAPAAAPAAATVPVLNRAAPAPIPPPAQAPPRDPSVAPSGLY